MQPSASTLQPTLDVQLDKLTYGGDAMGRLPDGRAVFVPFASPGERVRVRIVEEKRGYARGELLEVLAPSAERIPPRCPHFGVCGGCHYQQMPYAAQLRVKEAILRDQLERVGKIQNPPVRPIVPSPSEWNYRNHVQFHLTPEGKLGYVGAGLAPAQRSGTAQGTGARPAPTIIPITECHLPEDPINALWPQLGFDPDTGIQRVSLRLGADEDVMLVLESEDANPPELEIEADVSVVHLYEEDAVVLAGDDHVFINVLGRPFRVSAASFFQVNTRMAAALVKHLLTNLP
ncbi:MAG: TRAM domain-containing protein, partial [Chloroflexi bacterium]|nr:TRAM domain-containing protein [Chloroflexota bacterium]